MYVCSFRFIELAVDVSYVLKSLLKRIDQQTLLRSWNKPPFDGHLKVSGRIDISPSSGSNKLSSGVVQLEKSWRTENVNTPSRTENPMPMAYFSL